MLLYKNNDYFTQIIHASAWKALYDLRIGTL